MKRNYIKPEAEVVEAKTTPMLEGSDPNTNWTIGGGDIGEGPDPEDPEAGDAKQVNIWDAWE